MITIVLFVLSILGIAVCWLILLYQAGDRRVRKKLCKGTARYNCDRAIPGKRLRLAELGLIYWVAQGLFLVLAGVEGNTGALSVLFFSCVPAAALAIVLIGYQAVRRAWCRLCLMVAGIVFLQLAAVLIPGTKGSLPPPGSLVLYAVCWVLAGAWFFFSPPRVSLVRSKLLRRELTFFKNDPQVLRTLLKKQKMVDAGRWEEDIFLGNPAAPVQLLAVLSPACSPCAEAHAQLLKLAAAWPESVGIAIRVKTKYHEQWCEANGITGTPAIFINGRELPAPYGISDLRGLIPGLVKAGTARTTNIT